MTAPSAPTRAACAFIRQSTWHFEIPGLRAGLQECLTTLPMGGGKAVAISTQGKSDNEVMRLCQSFMSELFRHIDPTRTCPPGISASEAARSVFCSASTEAEERGHGVLTGKGWTGRLAHPAEATATGLCISPRDARHEKSTLEGKACLVSGSGNVAHIRSRRSTNSGERP